MKDKFNNRVGPQIKSRSTLKPKTIPVLAIILVVVSLSVSTQYFASMFGYQPILGSSLYGFYAPWAILEWAHRWYANYPSPVMKAAGVGMAVISVGFIILLLVQMITRNSSKANRYLHGSARWANKKDIEQAGLLPRSRIFKNTQQKPNSGVYVGAWEDRSGKLSYLKHNGPEHVLCYAPTRSGKGVGLVIPTMLSWTESAVITDLKGELWALSSGWRKEHGGNKVVRFEPAVVSGSAHWNPLDEIRLGEHEVGDVQNLATLIVDPDGKGLNSHWQKTSQALLVGVILHVLYKAKKGEMAATLPAVDAMMADPNRDVAELWVEMCTYKHDNRETHPVVSASARDMMDRPEEEAGSVLSTAKSYLALFRDPVVAQNVSKSDFKISDLMHNDDPVSLYIVTQPSDKSRLKPLIRIMVNMIVRLLSTGLEFENGRGVARYKHRLLMMLDEFPSMGRLEIFQESLAFMAGYGIKCYLVCQDINQLKSDENGYGRNELITSNCHVQNAYPPNRIETAEHLSKLTGETTVIKERVSVSGRRTSMLLGNVSRNLEEVKRNLMTPDECLRMPGPIKNDTGDIEEAGDMIVHIAGFPAIYGKQPLYFQDTVFQARASVPAPQQGDIIRTTHSNSLQGAVTI